MNILVKILDDPTSTLLVNAYHWNEQLDLLLAFAKAERAAEARTVKDAYARWLPSTIPKSGDWSPPPSFTEWMGHRAAQWEKQP